MKRTKKLSNEDYDGIPMSIPEFIVKHVNKENLKWYVDEIPPIPQIKKCDGIKYSAGWVNFVKTLLKDNLNELRP